ncbi:DUF429 domain-containing protein [Mycobacterium yunnanensis]|uniref:DUF429 domain-containing protein n=1 Tax=Mycobacterium yunnanensis TaxID=368477 RepID=A0A9X2Z0S9_9MYCO|nr:DUF429 domain-containing protein [Mycobacterium yunnanensis]MCV7421379.1 DUF429 domain-containing protein [Mycobacterium yunnanensis]
MDTIGISLTAQPSKTWMALVSWEDGKAELQVLQHGVNNFEVGQVTSSSDIVGISCPFGWPKPFTDFVTRYSADQHGGSLVGSVPSDSGMRYRFTAHLVKQLAPGINPPSALSGSAAVATLRCATILAECGQTPASIGHNSYPTKFVEVYPPASLSQWGLPYTGYKSASGQKLLVSMVTKLVTFTAFAGPWLKLDRWLDTCQTEVGAFEAVICALTARAVALERAISPHTPPEHHAAASEGWIWVPNEQSLSQLNTEPR